MPTDPLAKLTRLQEQEERAVATVEEHQRRLAMLQALLADAKRQGKAAAGTEVQVQAAEQALPADLKDEEA